VWQGWRSRVHGKRKGCAAAGRAQVMDMYPSTPHKTCAAPLRRREPPIFAPGPRLVAAQEQSKSNQITQQLCDCC
jgi:hypothetical protein